MGGLFFAWVCEVLLFTRLFKRFTNNPKALHIK
jgi:hypothetical protein